MQPEADQIAPKSLPVWLSIPIILLSLAGGGYIIHWYVMTDPISHESKILGDAPQQAILQPGNGGRRVQVGQTLQSNRPVPVPARRSVSFDQDNGDLQIRTEKAHATLTVSKGKAAFDSAFYMDYTFLPKDAVNTIRTANRLHQNQAEMEAMKLDARQQNRIGALSRLGSPAMVLSAADKNALSSLSSAYASKPDPQLEPAMLKMLDEIADRSVDATKQSVVDRAANINKIVTPEMWQQYTASSGK